MIVTLFAKLRSSLRVVPLIFYRAVAGGTPVLVGFYIAHRWGLVEFGSYTVAAAIVTVALVITDWGCSRSLPREIAVAPRPVAAAFIASTNTSRVLVFCILASLTWAGSAMSLIRPNIAQYIWILAPWALVTIWSTNAISARVVDEEIGGIAIASVAGLAALVVSVWAAERAGAGPFGAAAAYVFAKCVEAATLIGRRWWLLGMRARHIVRTLVVLWPFGIQGILLVVYSRLPLFVIEHSGTPEAVGVVAAGTALQSVLLLLPACSAFIALPQFTVAIRDNRRHVHSIIHSYLLVCVAGMTAGIVGLVILRDVIAQLLRIPDASMGFVIAFAAVSIAMIGSVILSVLIQAYGGETAVARVSMITVIFALLFQTVLTSLLGIWGLIFGLLAAEATSVALLLSAHSRIASRAEANSDRVLVAGRS